MRAMPMTILQCLLSALCLSLPSGVLARRVSGDFKLSGVYTEHIVAKFALSAFAQGLMDLSFTIPDMYENERYLKVHLFVDTDWAKWKKFQLCEDKITLAKDSLPVQFDFNRPDDATKGEWKATVRANLKNDEESRTHYWYIVIDDCSLEKYDHDKKVPLLHFELLVWNDVGGNVTLKPAGNPNSVPYKKVVLTQLSADEINQNMLHTGTLIISTLIALLMLLHIQRTAAITNSVHAANFLVMAAAACDASASLCELIHLKTYEANGYGWYFFDAMSSHLEAMCDSLVAILLLAIASGWTLPTDVVGVPQNASFVQALIGGLRNPAGSLLVMSSAGVLAMTILALHALLAQWGRTYDDDFDSYHDLEHLPGKILMAFRMALGILLIAATRQTSLACPASLRGFYYQLAVVGTIWFQCLPVVTWVCANFVPYYLRHPAVSAGGAILQTTSLVLLAALVSSSSSNSAYHKLSHLQQKEDSLTDQLSSSSSNFGGSNTKARPTTWRIGKTKVRLD